MYEEYIANVASCTALNQWQQYVSMAEAALRRLQEHLDDIMQGSEAPNLTLDITVCTASRLTCFGYLPDGTPAVGGTLTSYLLGLFIGTVAQELRRERRQKTLFYAFGIEICLMLVTWSFWLPGILRIILLGGAIDRSRSIQHPPASNGSAILGEESRQT